MKIIDEKGNLFGKINLIDFLAILVLLTFIPVFYYGYKMINKKRGQLGPSVVLELNCKFIKVEPEVLKLISIGDVETSELEGELGKLLFVGEAKPYQHRLSLGEGEEFIKEDPRLKEVPAKIQIKAEVLGNNIYYKEKQVVFDLPFIFKTNKYLVEAVPVVDTEKSDDVKMDLTCKLLDVSQETLKVITVGDSEIDEIGVSIGELTWLGKFDNAPANKSIEIPARLKIIAKIKGTSLYYKDRLIALGSPLVFITSKYTLEAIPVLEEEIKKIESSRSISTITQKIIIESNVIFNNLTDDVANLICVGDKQINNKTGEVIALVLQVGKVTDDRISVNLGTGRDVAYLKNIGRKQVLARLRLNVNIDQEMRLYFNGKMIAPVSPLTFITDKYIIEGTLAKESLGKERWVKAQVKFQGIIPEVAKLIQVGDVTRGLDDEIRGSIYEINSKEQTALRVLDVQNSRFLIFDNPNQQDLVVTLNLLCEEKKTGLFFNYFPLKTGNVLVFDTALYTLSGIIIGVAEDNVAIPN